MRLRRFHPTEQPPPDVTVVAVLGLYRGGTSCVAGVLYHLGVHMGSRLMKGDRKNAGGYFEPVRLARRLRRMYDEPRLKRRAPRDQRISMLRRWYESEGRIAEQRHTLLGVKHPLLCVAGEDLAAACGDRLRWIAVDRPFEECLASLDRAGWWRRSLRRPLLLRLWQSREAFVDGRDALRIDYHDLLESPRRQIERIAGFLRLSPSPTALDAACAFVDPTLRHARASAEPVARRI